MLGQSGVQASERPNDCATADPLEGYYPCDRQHGHEDTCPDSYAGVSRSIAGRLSTSNRVVTVCESSACSESNGNVLNISCA